MKKFFTSLLALVGMAVGLTLTSCGGGGGSNDNGPNLEGLEVQVSGGTPSFDIYFAERRGRTNNYRCILRLGGTNTDGSFSLDPGYPRTSDDGQEVTLKGRLGFDSGRWLMSQEDGALFFGFPGNKNQGCAVLELIVEMAIREDGDGSITYTGKGYGYDASGNPDVPTTDEQGELGVDGPYYPINVTFPGGLSVTGPIQRLFDN